MLSKVSCLYVTNIIIFITLQFAIGCDACILSVNANQLGTVIWTWKFSPNGVSTKVIHSIWTCDDTWYVTPVNTYLQIFGYQPKEMSPTTAMDTQNLNSNRRLPLWPPCFSDENVGYVVLSLLARIVGPTSAVQQRWESKKIITSAVQHRCGSKKIITSAVQQRRES